MSGLNNQLSDFKKRIQETTSVPAWGVAHVKRGSPAPAPSHTEPAPQPTPGPSAPPSEGSVKKKKKNKNAVVYSQPLDKGTGSNVNTQLVYAVEYLKKQMNPMRLEDIAMFSRTPLTENQTLLEAFNSHPDVVINPKTGLYTFKHEYQVRTPEELLREIKLRGQEGAGISIKSLKESFPAATTVIEDFEKQGLVFVTRPSKDGQMRFVFWNEMSQEQGGKQVEPEFKSLWEGLTLPAEADLLKSLEQDGLQATAIDTGPIKNLPKKKGKKSRAANRQTKITNTHLADIDLSKDYVPPS